MNVSDYKTVYNFLQDARMEIDNPEADQILLDAMGRLEKPLCHHYDRGDNCFDPLYCGTCGSWNVQSCERDGCVICLMYRRQKLQKRRERVTRFPDDPTTRYLPEESK
jgi:hypothetical protein